MDKKQNISKDPYKGTRDFYPEDLAVQNFIFAKARQISENFGYEEYNAPVLEPTELYKAKSGDEIVNEQTYSFIDKGDRDVTLRPEMTPSLSRMVAKKKRELPYPLRWYSIQNFFRYERPQKGRVREFWQLNADIFGVEGIEAEVEMISLGYEIMKSLGAKDEDFVIKINYAGILEKILREDVDLELNEEEIFKTIKTIDRKNKLSEEEFKNRVINELGKEKGEKLIEKLKSEISEKAQENDDFRKCIELGAKLEKRGIKTELDPQLVRGFDYYTGIVFEFFDTNSDNNRSLFGGGRYDDLLDLFGEEKVPAVGFGMGDITMQKFLELRNLLPKYQSPTDLYICTLDPQYIDYANQLATKLRKNDLNIAVNYSSKKIGDQIAIANKKSIPYIICIGEDEIKNNKFKLKNMETGKEQEVTEEEIVNKVRT